MTAIIKLRDGDCSLEANNMDADGQYISVYDDNELVGVFNLEMVNAAYLTDNNERSRKG